MIHPDTHGGRSARHARGIPGRTSRWAIALVAITVGLVSLRTSQSSFGLSYLTESPLSAGIGLSAGWGLAWVGLETLRRGRHPRLGFLLAAAGIAWFLPEWSDPAIGLPIGFTIGLVLAWLYPPLVGHALFVMSGPSHVARLGRIVPIGYVLFVIGLGILPALAFDPRTAGCAFCPANLISVGAPPAAFDAATRMATALAAVWSTAAALVLATRLIQSRPLARRLRAPTLVPGIVFLILVAIALGRATVQTIPPTDPTDRLLGSAQAVALVALAAGAVWEWVDARQARGRVARVVADLAAAPPVGGLRDHLARILRDFDLQLAYPVENGGLVDARGRPANVEPRRGRTSTPIVRDGSVVAVIEHGADVFQDAGEIDEVVAAARLGLEHERLQAASRAQLDALRAARRRIVEAGDARRKQLERDLHDGAQQQLIALSIGLRYVDRDPATETWIDGAAAEVRVAMGELRTIAHGLYPTVLADEGFAAAVDALAEGSTVPIIIEEVVEERFDAAIEVAAYHVVAEVARGGVGPIRIRARRVGERLEVAITAPRISMDAAEEVADRVGAVDGSAEMVPSGEESMSLIAEMPCRS